MVLLGMHVLKQALRDAVNPSVSRNISREFSELTRKKVMRDARNFIFTDRINVWIDYLDELNATVDIKTFRNVARKRMAEGRVRLYG